MRRSTYLLIPLCITCLLIGGGTVSWAQGSGPVVDILGKPDTTSTPPDAQAYVSVVDPATGRLVDQLDDSNFSVQVSDEDVQASSSLDTTGVAVIMLIDRGGIGRYGDPRIGQAVDLVGELLDKLAIDGSETADMAALIGIRGREEGGLTPLVPFTDYDPNSIRNEFNGLRTEVVNEVTPLYDGIDQAIEWVVDNPDAEIEQKLTHRRPLIVVFSDGIDNRFSSESHETIIINKCLENNILLYAIRMGGGPTDADNLEALARQTNGIYTTHTPATEEETLSLFDDIVTQRQSYRVTFPLVRPKGDYQVHIRVVDTPIGDGSATETASSRLQLPKVTLSSPPEGTRYTVPYSQTANGFLTTPVQIGVQVTAPDGLPRDPSQVTYFANGVRIGSSTTPPDYPFSWDVSTVVTPTDETQRESFTLIAAAEDTYLEERTESAPLTIEVTWEPRVRPFQERVLLWLRANWWILLVLGGLLVGMVVLVILLARTRSELARKVVTRTTGVLKGFTKRLGALPSTAPAKLVVLQGANVGKEFRLAAQVVKVGRDPQFCDFALYDEYASNPHFSIQLDQTQFFITDEGSTNGTQLNGVPIPAHQRMLLQPDAIIEVGQTRLQFKRLGGTTRQLGSLPATGSSPGAPPASGPGQAGHPPTKPASPPGQQGAADRSGPTHRVTPG